MRLRKLTVRHFRNLQLSSMELRGRRQFLVGANGQGKTNLLEAAGFISALRSFRATDSRVLIAHGQAVAAVGCTVEHERMGETHITLKLRRDGKELWCDQERITRLADYLGRFPTVVFSSQDIQLVRGSSSVRRRWLDLTLAAMDPGYLRALQTYAKALAGRNRLLKRGDASDAEIAAFEHLLAPAAAELIATRAARLTTLGEGLAAAYTRVAGTGEPCGLAYEPDCEETEAEVLSARWAAGRARDVQSRLTLRGPHRDDFRLTVNGTAAREFGSEGQQRSLVLALRLAQAAWCQAHSGVRPVLLADDVLGELDPERRHRFWAAVDPEAQVIATGTGMPAADLGEWQIFRVTGGELEEMAPGGEDSV